MTQVVQGNSLLTLHYRIALADDTELIGTFGGAPATLQLGQNELAPALEQCLIGINTGERYVFLLEPQQAFGAHNPQLVQATPRNTLPPDMELKERALIEFIAPDGAKYAGLVRELTEHEALIDFNHPLAGKAIRFEVEVLAIL